MRKKLLVTCGLFALVGTIAVAAVLGTASIGKAGSTTTCTQLSQSATCFVVSAPLYVTSGQIGLATGTFKPLGSATSTHTVMTLTLPDGASVVTNGISTSRPATCPQSGLDITCSFNNVQSGTIVRMFVRFTAPSASVPQAVSGRLTFAEGNGGTNDTFTASSGFESVSGADKGGYCTNDKTKVVKNKLVPLLDTVGSTGQTATINSLQTLASAPGIPCTPLAAAVVVNNDSSLMCGTKLCTTQKSIVQFAATGTVTLLFPGQDKDNFTLFEISITNGQTPIQLKFCHDPPDPLQDLADGTDSCIVSQTNVTKNGTKYVQDVLAVFGQPLDGGYIG